MYCMEFGVTEALARCSETGLGDRIVYIYRLALLALLCSGDQITLETKRLDA